MWAAARRENPATAAKIRVAARALWGRHKEEIIAQREARIAAMTDEQREEWANRLRSYQREWRRAWRAKIYADDDLHREHLSKEAQWRADRALRTLMGVGAQLERIIIDDRDDDRG
jgi:acetoin utilization deacetylase AcuC-like enzyme